MRTPADDHIERPGSTMNLRSISIATEIRLFGERSTAENRPFLQPNIGLKVNAARGAELRIRDNTDDNGLFIASIRCSRSAPAGFSGGGKPKAQQHRDQSAFADVERGLGRREPASFALALLRPVVQLLLDLQKKDGDLACDGSFCRQALLVAVRTVGALPDLAPHPGLLEGFTGRHVMRLGALLGPSLGNDPAPCLARRDQKYLKAPLDLSVGQSGELSPRRLLFAHVLITPKYGSASRSLDGKGDLSQWGCKS